MKVRTLGTHLLATAGILGSLPLAANPLQHAYLSGLFRRAENDPNRPPLPPLQQLEGLAGKDGLKIRDTRGERFVFQVFTSHPGAAGAAAVAPKDLTAEFPADGATLVAPVDLTGSGVSDLLYARQGGGGFQVLSNGTRLPKPFQGFVAGFVPKEQESAKGGGHSGGHHRPGGGP